MNSLLRKGRMRGRKTSGMNFTVGTDKWRKASRFNYSADFNEEDSDEELSDDSRVDWEQEYFAQKNSIESQNEEDVEVYLNRKQTLIVSTLLPDELLLMDNFEELKPKRCVGVLLMADVSGYTALSERYSNAGKTGTYRLTATLNNYLGSLIELIYSHGGDVLKFAGDAFLALWKTDKRTFLSHTIHNVLTCALLIQHSFGNYETDVKVNLKVKLAISAGNIIFSPIGKGNDLTYVVTGLPVFEAKIAESLCASGEVKLAESAWGHCYSRNYIYKQSDDGTVTIRGILYDPRDPVVTKPFIGITNLVKPLKRPFSAIENIPNEYWVTPEKMNYAEMQKTREELSLRQSILDSEDKNIGPSLRRFMIRPILTQLDAHQPLEYLTEIRQVSILFMTLKPKTCTFMQLVTIVNNTYQITCEIVYKSIGCVNKIILFDKDVMILIIFGLRGFKHESEAQAALKCAYTIKKSVAALDGVQEVSIGLTTGQVYCGVVGHPLRREFTVIGAIVNKAARLMCNFRNKISCDETTFVNSKMSSNNFYLQPATELKGIQNAGKIYEYTEDITIREMFNIEVIPPLLDRHDEMKLYTEWLGDGKHSTRYSSTPCVDGFLIIGDSRSGKSRLLEWMARHARNANIKIIHLNLTSIHATTTFLGISQIIHRILGVSESPKKFETEEKMVNFMNVYSDEFCYLNSVLDVRFAHPDGKVIEESEETKIQKTKRIFLDFVSHITETHAIFIDNLKHLDPLSWEYLSILIKSPHIFAVFTLTKAKFTSAHQWLYSVFTNTQIKKIYLKSLTQTWLAPLACQILNVDAVPVDLCTALRFKCKSMPGLIESFIVHLFSSGALQIVKVALDELDEYSNEDYEFPEQNLLKPKALNANEQDALDMCMAEAEAERNDESAICIITNKEELDTDMNTQNKDAVFMTQIDTLTPYQQLLLKIASVIGNVFSRDLLEKIMYENKPITTAKAIKRLFAMRIFVCANSRNRYSRKSTAGLILSPRSSLYAALGCDCPFEINEEENGDLPKYAFCEMIKFKSTTSRRTCYELLPLNQKKEFHSRIVYFLENNEQKCPSCGGKSLVAVSIIDMNINQNPQSGSMKQSSYYEIPEYSGSEENEIDQEVELRSNIGFSSAESIKYKVNQNSLKVPGMKASAQASTLSLSPINSMSYQNSVLKRKSTIDDSQRRYTKRVTMPSLVYKKSQQKFNVIGENESRTLESFRAILEADTIERFHNIGIFDPDDKNSGNEESYSVKLEAALSKINISSCTCQELREKLCGQVVHHAKEAELFVHFIKFLIKQSYLFLLRDKFDEALPKLYEAEKYANEKPASDSLDELTKRRFMAKIHTLKAAAFMISNDTTDAKVEIEKAIKLYNIRLDRISAFFTIAGFDMFTSDYKAYKSKMEADMLFCLNIATMLYSFINDERNAKICASKALRLASTNECAIKDVYNALCNAIQFELDRGMPEATIVIDRKVNAAMKKINKAIKTEDLSALGKLFTTLFHAQVALPLLPEASRTGYRSLAISRFLQADSAFMEMVPSMFYVLMSRGRISECVELLKDTLILGRKKNDLSYETWYYALCMDLILDGGCQLEPPNEINRFAEYTMTRGPEVCGETGLRRLYVSLWVYWMKASAERRAKRFEGEVFHYSGRENPDGSLTTLLSNLRLAEGMLECLSRKMDDLRKVVDMMELRSLADKELLKMEKDVRLCKACFPRWAMLRGKCLQLSGRTAASTYYTQATEEAKRGNNLLEQSQLKCLNTDLEIWLQEAKAGMFMSWKDSLQYIPKHWHEIMYNTTTKTVKYSIKS